MGIDISPMPVRHGQTPARRLRLAGKRMLWRAGRGFVVRDLPECARPRAQQRGRARRYRINRSEQQLGYCCGRGRPLSAVIALGGIPNKVQVGDMGVDGRIFPRLQNKGQIDSHSQPDDCEKSRD